MLQSRIIITDLFRMVSILTITLLVSSCENKNQRNNEGCSTEVCACAKYRKSQRNPQEIADDLILNLSQRFDEERVKQIVQEIDKSNVKKVFSIYARYASQFKRDVPSIASHLLNKCDEDTARQLLDHIVKAMQEYAQEQGIDITEHVEKYNEAYNRKINWYNFIGRTQRIIDIDKSFRSIGWKINGWT